MLLARGFAGGFELFEAGGVEWGLSVKVEYGLPCFVECGEVGTHAGGVGVGFHVVDGEGVEVAVGGVGGWGEEWVGVIVDCLDGGDLGGQGGVNGGACRLREANSRNREQRKNEFAGCIQYFAKLAPTLGLRDWIKIESSRERTILCSNTRAGVDHAI